MKSRKGCVWNIEAYYTSMPVQKKSAIAISGTVFVVRGV
jgi:hypothetical protein